jgi:hypothetical protein
MPASGAPRHTVWLLAASAVCLAGGSAAVRAEDQAAGKNATRAAGSSAWFVAPPPAKASLADTGTHLAPAHIAPPDSEGTETIVVTAQKRPIQRDPHGEEPNGYRPMQSEAASPTQGDVAQGACHGAAYQTVAGQAATGMDMISMGGGQC